MKDIGLRIRDADLDAGRQKPSADVTTIGDVWEAFRRQFLVLLVCAIAGLSAGVLHHATTPKQYYTSAVVLVDERRSELDEQINAGIPFARNDTSILNEIQVLKSLQLATEVAGRIDLHENAEFLNPPSSLARTIVSGFKTQVKDLIGLGEAAPDIQTSTAQEQQTAQMEQAASRLQRDIRIERIGLSFSIDISYIGHDPALSSLIVNTYAEAFLADRLNANVEATERAAEWMRTRLDAIEQSSADVQAEAAALRASDPTQVTRLRELAQRAVTLDDLHQTLSARFEQVSVQGSFPVSNGRILTRSIVPKTPALPKLWQTAAVTLLLGLMVGFVLATWRESQERFFRTARDVRDHTGLPFLGYLPKANVQRRRASLLAETSQSDAGQNNGLDLPPHFFWAVSTPQSVFGETMRNIHATVSLGAPDAGKVIAFASMGFGEARTMAAFNYANLLARSGEAVLLIEMGQRDSCERRQPEAGLGDILNGAAQLSDALHILDHTGLHVLPSGSGLQNQLRGDLTSHHQIRVLLAELRKHYQYIVVDLPPLKRAADTKAIVNQLGKIILVCAWGKAQRARITQFLANEPEIAQRIAGTTLSNVDMRKLRKYARPGSLESALHPAEGWA